MADVIKVEMEFEKETKRTYRFKATDEEAPVPILYVKKDAFKKQPEKISLAIG